MGTLTLTTFLTLDGVMQAPGGPTEDTSGGFRYGGWLVPHFDADLGGFVDRWFANADAFLLGRSTYQIFAGHWPRVTDADNPIAVALNKLPKHVASTTLKTVEWNNSSLVEGDVVKGIEALKRRYPRELQVHGSAGLAQTLIAGDLIDEYRLITFPVVLGAGKRLFGSGTIPGAFELIDARTTSTGVAVNAYRRKGPATFGSFQLED
jgi:dihydrofolate reductase